MKLELVTDVPDKAMVIFAHPDDAEISSGGVVAKWVAGGCEVTYVLCTNGQAGTADRSVTPPELASKRADEQRAAADFMGVKHVVMLGYPDGELDDSRAFLADVVRAIRQYRPHTVFVHDPYRIKGFQHRDHRKTGIVTTDAVYPYARDHLHFPEQITRDGLQPHKVRELWYWGMDEPNVIVDVTDSIDRQIAALIRHESQMPGFNVSAGETIGQRLKQHAAELAESHGVVVTGAASPAQAVGGLTEARPGVVVAGAASPAQAVGGLTEARPGFVVAGAVSPAQAVGGLTEARPGVVVAGAASPAQAVGGLTEARPGFLYGAVFRRLIARR